MDWRGRLFDFLMRPIFVGLALHGDEMIEWKRKYFPGTKTLVEIQDRTYQLPVPLLIRNFLHSLAVLLQIQAAD